MTIQVRAVEVEAHYGHVETTASLEPPISVEATADTTLSVVGRATPKGDRRMAQQNNFEWYHGEHIKLGFTMVPATNVAGWTVVLTARRNVGDAEVVLQVPDGRQLMAAKFQIEVTNAQSLKLPPGSYAYDVQRVDPGFEAMLSLGVIKVKPSVLYTVADDKGVLR